jgi:hypothetical protein
MAEEERVPRTSPVFQKVLPKPEEGVMDFGSCLMLLTLIPPARARRQEWPEDNTYITIQNEKLMLFDIKDNRLHPLFVSVGDIVGKDWILVHAGDKPKVEA